MPLTSLKKCLDYLSANEAALGCFNIVNYETLSSVLKAAEHKNSPVCLTIHPPHFKYNDIGTFMPAVREAAESCRVPVVLHLDNVEDIEMVVSGIKGGFTSLMYIGKKDMGLEQKVKSTRLAADIAHYSGFMLESDVPYHPDRDVYIEKIIDFLHKTGADIISPNIMDKNREEPDIDFGLLSAVKEKTGKYISLHGGSGISDDSIKKAIKKGLDKMHIYGKAANLALEEARAYLQGKNPDLIEAINGIGFSFGAVAEKNIDIYGSAGTSDDILDNKTAVDRIDPERIAEVITKIVQKNLKNH